MTSLRILICDDHELVRQGLRTILEEQEGWEVCGEAVDGQDAVNKAVELKPDIIILDISMPKLSGLEAMDGILKALQNTIILILTVHESEQLVRDVMEAGASGYLLKSSAGRDLKLAVQSLLRLKNDRNDAFSDETGGQIMFQGSAPFTYENLTMREREVLKLLAEGMNIKTLAVHLGMSVKTADTHRNNIMRKLDIHSIGELVLYAARNNIISLAQSN